jgi:hypothetical protein
VALFVMMALAACAQGGQAQAPYARYPPENVHNRGRRRITSLRWCGVSLKGRPKLCPRVGEGTEPGFFCQ